MKVSHCTWLRGQWHGVQDGRWGSGGGICALGREGGLKARIGRCGDLGALAPGRGAVFCLGLMAGVCLTLLERQPKADAWALPCGAPHLAVPLGRWEYSVCVCVCVYVARHTGRRTSIAAGFSLLPRLQMGFQDIGALTGTSYSPMPPQCATLTTCVHSGRMCVCEQVGTPVSTDLRRDMSGHVSSAEGRQSQPHNPRLIRANQLEVPDVTSSACDNCASSNYTPVAERTLPTFCLQWPDEFVFGDQCRARILSPSLTACFRIFIL